MFAEKIINWYHENGRNLPWRCTDNPYYIWLSEIILQQTRIEQGRAYYEHFITRYPTVQHLADATEEQVLKSWQGLGYYSRARNLHTAARHIAYDLHGVFPSTYKEILALKGVGRYTAAAIASFAFRLPYPVIDGNVYRLIARLYGIHTPIGTTAAQREFENLLNTLIDPVRPDLFNQAIMDFGSMQCKPTGCDCANCIFSHECTANKHGQVASCPSSPIRPRSRSAISTTLTSDGRSQPKPCSSTSAARATSGKASTSYPFSKPTHPSPNAISAHKHSRPSPTGSAPNRPPCKSALHTPTSSPTAPSKPNFYKQNTHVSPPKCPKRSPLFTVRH